MKNAIPISLMVALAIAASVAMSCGNAADPSHPGDPLESITVSPAVADAKDYPDGQVQFTAAGYYSTNPNQAVPLSKPGWGSCYENNSTSEVTVSSTGVAQCASGAVGTYTVWADAPPNVGGPNCLAVNACGGGCFVTGTAQLTCP
jgi:hypothetical protein